MHAMLRWIDSFNHANSRRPGKKDKVRYNTERTNREQAPRRMYFQASILPCLFVRYARSPNCPGMGIEDRLLPSAAMATVEDAAPSVLALSPPPLPLSSCAVV